MKLQRPMKHFAILTVTMVLALGLAACGDAGADDDHNHDEHNEENNDHNEESLAEHACEHAQNGPYSPEEGAHQAGEDRDDAPEMHPAEWTTVELHEHDGAYEGAVLFHAEDDGAHAFFSSVAWSDDDQYLTVTDADGEELAFEEAHAVDEEEACPEVAYKHVFEGFEAGEEYLVEIHDHPDEMISMVGEGVEEDDHDHDHDE